MELKLETVHESVVNAVLAKCDLRSKCTLMCTCRFMFSMLAAPQYWRELHWKDHEEQQGMGADNFATVLQRSQGSCYVIHLARCVAQSAVRQIPTANIPACAAVADDATLHRYCL